MSPTHPSKNGAGLILWSLLQSQLALRNRYISTYGMSKNAKFEEKLNFLHKCLLREPSSILGKHHYHLVT